MNEFSEQQVIQPVAELNSGQRATIIRNIYRDLAVFNELIVTPTAELVEYIGDYVDLRQINAEEASKQYPALEQGIQRGKDYRKNIAMQDIGRQGVRHGF